MQNMIKGINIQNEWCEDPQIVKKQVKEFFQTRLLKSSEVRIRLGNIVFQSITKQDNCMLTKSFSEVEIESNMEL